MSCSTVLRGAALGFVTVVLVVASACSNISLSSNSASFGASSGAPVAGGLDGGGTGGAVSLGSSDAGAAPAIIDNPLCNEWVTEEDGGTSQRVCDPDGLDTGPDGGGPCSLGDAGDVMDADLVPLHADDAGDDGGASSDAGAAPPPVDANPPGPVATPACRVAPPDAGALQMCSAAGQGRDGDECGKSSDCAGGYECVGSPGQCRHYCCAGNSVCDVTYAPSFCNPETVVTGGYRVPVCIPISGCTLFGKCPGGQTCAVVKDDGTTSCVPIGTEGIGQSCDEADCAAGLDCLGTVGSRICYQLCHVAATSECPAGTQCTGSAQLFQDPQFGICR